MERQCWDLEMSRMTVEGNCWPLIVYSLGKKVTGVWENIGKIPKIQTRDEK